MKLEFDSIEEVKDFVTKLKGTRGGKKDEDDAPSGQAPAPLQPPAGASGFPGAPGFAPPAGGAGPGAGAFPAAGAPVMAPEVQALVNRIVTAVDGSIAKGQPTAAVTDWFQKNTVPEAASATLDQIKQVILPKMTVAQLDYIAKLMNA